MGKILINKLIKKKSDYTHLARRVTAPATTGEATLVPERERHPSFIPDPRTPEP